MNGIRKETGRATYDEVLRLRLRLDILEGERGSLVQSVAATSGQIIGTVGTFLKLDCSNDPLTGDLEVRGFLTITKGGHIETATEGRAVLTLDSTAFSSMDPDDASVAANLHWWWDGALESGRTDLDPVTSFTLNPVSTNFTTLTKIGGTVTYHEATGGPNSKPWIETTGNSRFLATTAAFATAGYTVIAVYRTSDVVDDAASVMFGESGAASKKGLYHPGTTNTNTWDTYLIYDEGDSAFYPASASVEGGNPAPQTWFCGVWRKDTDDVVNIFHASTTVALADVTVDPALVREEALDLDLLWGDQDGGTANAQTGCGVAEFIIYDKTLTDQQLSQVYAFLAEKYGFPTPGGGGDLLDMTGDIFGYRSCL